MGDTPVNRQQWEKIVELATSASVEWKQFVEELTPWVNETFEEFECFTIIGM